MPSRSYTALFVGWIKPWWCQHFATDTPRNNSFRWSFICVAFSLYPSKGSFCRAMASQTIINRNFRSLSKSSVKATMESAIFSESLSLSHRSFDPSSRITMWGRHCECHRDHTWLFCPLFALLSREKLPNRPLPILSWGQKIRRSVFGPQNLPICVQINALIQAYVVSGSQPPCDSSDGNAVAIKTNKHSLLIWLSFESMSSSSLRPLEKRKLGILAV